MSPYTVSDEAQADLESAHDFGSQQWGEAAADTYIIEIFDLFETLSGKPYLGRVRSDLSPGLRSFPFRAHMVFYIVSGDGARIVRVLHGSLDIPARFHRLT